MCSPVTTTAGLTGRAHNGAKVFLEEYFGGIFQGIFWWDILVGRKREEIDVLASHYYCRANWQGYYIPHNGVKVFWKYQLNPDTYTYNFMKTFPKVHFYQSEQ